MRRRCLDFEIPGNNQQTVGESSSSCVVPSIGLHLNAVAMPSKDNNVANEYSFSGNMKVGLQSSTTPLLQSQHDSVRENETGKDAGKVIEVVPKSSGLVELTPISPKKKRQVCPETCTNRYVVNHFPFFLTICWHLKRAGVSPNNQEKAGRHVNDVTAKNPSV